MANRPIVFSLVSNTCTHDARVLKQAQALAEQGYEVTVYARTGKEAALRERINGFDIVRFDCFSYTVDLEDERVSEVLQVFGECAALVREQLEASRHMVGLRSTASKARRAAPRRTLKAQLRNALRLARDYARRLRAFAQRRIGEYLRQRERAAGCSALKRLIPTPRIAPAEEQMFYIRYFLYAYHLMRVEPRAVPEIIHAHDLYTLPAALVLARRTGAKVIFDAHEIETERVPPLPPVRKDYIDRLERTLLVNTDAMIVCCDSAADFYHERMAKRRPTVVMNAPTFLEASTDEAGSPLEIFARLRALPNAKVLIYTGGVGREGRGLDKVTQALRYLPDVHLVILGPRHLYNDEWLIGVAKAANVHDRVHLVPPVPHHEVVAAIRSADAGVCLIQDVSLSYRYAMPNKLFEMAFAGLPLCVSDLPEMRKFVSEMGVGIWVDQTDPSAIATGLREVLERPENYRPNAAMSLRMAEKYSWDAQKRALGDLYREILE